MMKIHKLLTRVNRTIMTNKKNKYLVIHYTGNSTDTAYNNARYFESSDRGASAHYFVDDNEIWQVVEDKDSAWSVGKNYGSNNLFGVVTNKNSISIEMCSVNSRISEKTFENTVMLAKSLMSKYDIPKDRVYRHYDVCSKECPGWSGWLPGNDKYWKKFKKELGNSKSSSSKNEKNTSPSSNQKSFKVKIKVESLNVRKGPGTQYPISMAVYSGDVYTIVDTNGSWGKLKSGAGWININSKYASRV